MGTLLGRKEIHSGNSNGEKCKHTFSWIRDKELITDACTYIKAQDDSICFKSKKKIKLIIYYNKDGFVQACAVCTQLYKN